MRANFKPGSDIPGSSQPPQRDDKMLHRTVHLMRLYIAHRRASGSYSLERGVLTSKREDFAEQRELIDAFDLAPRNIAFFFFRHYSNHWMNVFTSRKVVDAFLMNRDKYPPPTYHLTVYRMNKYMKSMDISPRRTILSFRRQKKPILPRVLFAFQHDAHIKQKEKDIAVRKWFRAPTPSRMMTTKWYPDETGVLDGLVKRRKQEEGFGVNAAIIEALATDKAG